MSVELIKVKEADDGMRLNRWFLKYYPNLTLGRLQKLLRTKQIKVDGKRAEASLKLAAGQEAFGAGGAGRHQHAFSCRRAA